MGYHKGLLSCWAKKSHHNGLPGVAATRVGDSLSYKLAINTNYYYNSNVGNIRTCALTVTKVDWSLVSISLLLPLPKSTYDEVWGG